MNVSQFKTTKAIAIFLILLFSFISIDTFAKKRKSKRKKYTLITFKGISDFDYRSDEEIPEHISNLHGKYVKIKGFIFPKRKVYNAHDFYLLGGNSKYCCTGRELRINNLIEVNMKGRDRLNANYQKEVTVYGIFYVQKKYNYYREPVSLFQIYAHKVKYSDKKKKKKRKKKKRR